jgi:hypothetical protein
LIIFLVPRLNDKDLDILSKALFYSKKAYEEACLAKEISIRIETTMNNFIKEHIDHQNENSDALSNKTKGFNKKQNFWYTVRCFS